MQSVTPAAWKRAVREGRVFAPARAGYGCVVGSVFTIIFGSAFLGTLLHGEDREAWPVLLIPLGIIGLVGAYGLLRAVNERAVVTGEGLWVQDMVRQREMVAWEEMDRVVWSLWTVKHGVRCRLRVDRDGGDPVTIGPSRRERMMRELRQEIIGAAGLISAAQSPEPSGWARFWQGRREEGAWKRAKVHGEAKPPQPVEIAAPPPVQELMPPPVAPPEEPEQPPGVPPPPAWGGVPPPLG